MTTANKEFKGSAVSTFTTNTINSSDTAVSIDDSTGWPTGARNFTAVLGRGSSREEKVLCSARSGVGLTILTRGYDNTTAQNHSAGETIEHCIAATDLTALFTHATDTTVDDHTQYLKVTTAASTYETSAHATATYETTTHAAATYAPVSTITTASVATAEVRNNAAYGDLATSGPAVTVTVPASGKVKVTVQAVHSPSSGDTAQMGFAISGANTASPTAANSTYWDGANTLSTSREAVLTGLTPGSTTFTAKYVGSGGTGCTFQQRTITVETKP